MSAKPHFDSVRRSFSDQFEPDGADFLYRRDGKGARIRVSQAERDRFVAAFNRRFIYAIASMLPATALLVALLIWLVPHISEGAAYAGMVGGSLLIVAPYIAIYRWAWNSPARELRRRTA